LKLYKQGQFIYYFINDTFIYHNDISDLKQGGENAGLLIYANNTVYLKDFKVYLDKPVEKSYKEMAAQLFEIEKPFIKKREY
jgi:hypothetical protein